MATDVIPGSATSHLPDGTQLVQQPPGAQPDSARRGQSVWGLVERALVPLASLKLTVALFAMAIFIVFAGTLAQVDRDIWYVIREYFRVDIAGGHYNPFVFIPFQIFLPPAFFPDGPHVPDSWWIQGFWFPKGWTIGAAMFVNLLAAHAIRFKVQARGHRLWGGLAAIALGVLVAWLVVLSGSNKDGLQGAPLVEWSTMWRLFLVGLALTWVATIYAALMLDPRRRVERWMLAGLAVALGGALLAALILGDAVRLNDSSMRILWQLIKGSFAGAVLLAGCWIVFGRRAGVVLLHAGIGLMMLSEVYVGLRAEEGRMRIEQGQAVNFAEDIRSFELAIVDPAHPDEERHIVVPGNMITAGGAIRDERLPFDIEVVEFLENSSLRDLRDGEQSRAAQGTGQRLVSEPRRRVSGTSSGGEVDAPSAYIRLTDRRGNALGTWLVSVFLSPQTVKAEDHDWELALRFKRTYKPFWIQAREVIKEDYVGTNTPRDYRTKIRLLDVERSVVRLATGATSDGKPVFVKVVLAEGESASANVGEPARFTGQFLRAGEQGPELKDCRQISESAADSSDGAPVSLSADQLGESFAADRQRLEAEREGALITVTGTVAERSSEFEVDREIDIWMNNPLRYAGETFYQSDYAPPSREVPVPTTVLQVVTNAGWMVPYVGCMIVATGMLATFLQTLVRFLNRRAEGRLEPNVAGAVAGPAGSGAASRHAGRNGQGSRKSRYGDRAPRTVYDWAAVIVPVLLVAILGGLAVSWARPPKAPPSSEMNLYAFGQLPVASEGRVKPFDTLARTTLRLISGHEDFVDSGKKKQPAIRWMLDAITDREKAEQHRVFAIENFEVQELLGLERRVKDYRYAYDEFEERLPEFFKQVQQADAKSPLEMTVYDRKVLALAKKLEAFEILTGAFLTPPLPPFPTIEQLHNNPEEAAEALQRFRVAVTFVREGQLRFERSSPPRAVPLYLAPDESSDAIPLPLKSWLPKRDPWETYTSAWTLDLLRRRALFREPNPATDSLERILVAYREGDAQRFNSALTEYRRFLETHPRDDLNVRKVRFESYFNHAAPFYHAAVLYLIAFVLVALGWLGWSRLFNRASFWLIVVAFLIHTLAIAARIYISGRPPVTNLYTTAVFIGWGCAALAMAFEAVYRMSIGNAVASVAGFMTLLIAHFLSGGRDTFTVLQAVLDTQFWLATHVVTINLGYSAMLVAGLLGMFYILAGVLTTALSPSTDRALTRMMYGTVCFAMFFSFVGTVLGGLWADDSWGRFWGWDPKENGALMIVLWAALVLHARWGGIVRDRGLAALTVGGSIVTTWSWFGVNELGVGLHSYGFTEGVLRALGLFAASQLAVIGIGLLPRRLWVSSLRRGQHAA